MTEFPIKKVHLLTPQEYAKRFTLRQRYEHFVTYAKLLGMHSAEYQAYRRVQLALKTSDPRMHVKALQESAESAIREEENQNLFTFWTTMLEIFDAALDELDR